MGFVLFYNIFTIFYFCQKKRVCTRDREFLLLYYTAWEQQHPSKPKLLIDPQTKGPRTELKVFIIPESGVPCFDYLGEPERGDLDSLSHYMHLR